MQADAAGTGTVPFNLGVGQSYRNPAQNFVSGGDSRPAYLYTNLTSPVERNVAAGTFTFADLALIEDAFLRVLATRFHSRIRYPGQDEEGVDDEEPEKAP